MLKYAKIVNNESKKCDVAIGTDTAYYETIGMTLQEVEQDWRGQWYLAGYAPEKPRAVIIQEEIDHLKTELADMDYKQFKYLRGEFTDEEWEVIKGDIQAKTQKINELEAELAK